LHTAGFDFRFFLRVNAEIKMKLTEFQDVKKTD
jgi:hypothetical protein